MKVDMWASDKQATIIAARQLAWWANIFSSSEHLELEDIAQSLSDLSNKLMNIAAKAIVDQSPPGTKIQ